MRAASECDKQRVLSAMSRSAPESLDSRVFVIRDLNVDADVGRQAGSQTEIRDIFEPEREREACKGNAAASLERLIMSATYTRRDIDIAFKALLCFIHLRYPRR
jgi:hypothetical protein